MAAASSKSHSPAAQSLITMTGPFWDTVVLCAVTGLVIVSSILKNPGAYENVPMDSLCFVAFGQLPFLGEEMLSLSERFGIQITFQKPDKKTYLDIVRHLAKDRGVEMPVEELEAQAERFALGRGGRSARAATQFIDSLLAK